VSGIFVPKNYQNLITGFKLTVKNVGDVFLRHSAVPLKSRSNYQLLKYGYLKFSRMTFIHFLQAMLRIACQGY